MFNKLAAAASEEIGDNKEAAKVMGEVSEMAEGIGEKSSTMTATAGEESSTMAATAGEATGEADEATESGFAALMAKAQDPKVMAALKKASGSKKIKAAIADCQKNGVSSISKYMSDPEIMGILNDLKTVF